MHRPTSYYGRPPSDRNHIDISDPLELRWWCGRFGCTDLKLKEALAHVGNAPSQVEQYLRLSVSYDVRNLAGSVAEQRARKKTAISRAYPKQRGAARSPQAQPGSGSVPDAAQPNAATAVLASDAEAVNNVPRSD